MGRKRLYGQETADALLEAAERIVEREGYHALTVRSLAEATGTTTRAMYSAAGSKPALLGRLGARGFDLLSELVEAIPVTQDAAGDLVDAGWLGFRRFAVEHPGLFLIAVQQRDVPDAARVTIQEAASRALGSLHRRIERVQAAGGLADRPVSVATVQFHALCEGLAAVELRGILTAYTAELVWTDALHSLVSGWRKATGYQPEE